jgi:solute carrier family 45, member 1/2/4
MLIRSFSAADIDVLNEDVEYAGSKPAGGTIMGIHNLAIVFPQFLIAIIASFIFKMSEATAGNEGSPGGAHKNNHAVAHVLQFGGCMALAGALICRKVPPTKTEKAMRRRLAEIREESGNNSA